MSGSGAWTGIARTIIRTALLQARRALHLGSIAFCAAAHGAATMLSCVPRTGAGTFPRAGTSAMVFAWLFPKGIRLVREHDRVIEIR